VRVHMDGASAQARSSQYGIDWASHVPEEARRADRRWGPAPTAPCTPAAAWLRFLCVCVCVGGGGGVKGVVLFSFLFSLRIAATGLERCVWPHPAACRRLAAATLRRPRVGGWRRRRRARRRRSGRRRRSVTAAKNTASAASRVGLWGSGAWHAGQGVRTARCFVSCCGLCWLGHGAARAVPAESVASLQQPAWQRASALGVPFPLTPRPPLHVSLDAELRLYALQRRRRRGGWRR
jgi:hypothetical protein